MKFRIILGLLLIFSALFYLSKANNNNNAYSTSTQSQVAESNQSPMVTEAEALTIANKDAREAYRDISIYRIAVTSNEDHWYINYKLKDPNLNGGGPHYVISKTTGELVSKTYWQ